MPDPLSDRMIHEMARPLAYFLSWTCYGQRLHGDDRGSVDALHNEPGTPYLETDPAREARARRRMKSGIVLLTPAMRSVVDEAIDLLCLDRAWTLAARAVRATHVHVVTDCRGQISPERALALFKARATRSLRLAGLAESASRLWTHHGSTRWINSFPSLYAAVLYVNEWQSGPNRRVLEEHRHRVRAIMEEFKNRQKSAVPDMPVADNPVIHEPGTQ